MEKEEGKEFLDSFQDEYPKELTDKYIILECLGTKEYEDTLLVRQRDNRSKYVLKCFKKEHPLFDYETPSAVKTIQCEGIPKFIEEIHHNDMRCVIREYVEGVTLDQYQKDHLFTKEDVISVGIQICKILKYLHSQTPPIIHRDIKPQNIIWDEDNRIALIDFGISRTVKPEVQSDTVFSGTKRFAPPEQYGFKQTDARSDIYALGVLLTWMLTNSTEMISNPKTSLDKILIKCMAFSPDARYQNAGLLLNDLMSLTSDRKKHRKRVCVLLMTVIAVSAIVIGMMFHFTRDYGVVFKEPLIEKAVRLVLDKSTGPISEEDLLQIKGIYIVNEQVFANLNNFAEVAWSQDDHWKNRGPITSIEDLAKMTNLEEVCIGTEHISDINALKNLKNLRKIELCFNDVERLDGLENKLLLKEVGLNANPLTDITALGSCPSVISLDLRDTGGAFTGEALEQMGDFDFIDMCCDTEVWKYLQGKTIRYFKVGRNMTDLEFVKEIAYVEDIEINWSTISDISALTGRTDITSLEMIGCNITDVKPLFTIPNLQKVTVSSSTKQKIEEIDAKPPFEIICE